MNRLPRWLSILCMAAISSTVVAAERPNFLILIADDCTYNDLPLYGGRNVRTPNIDHLASQGLTFNKAFLGQAICQPCRAELYTGQYQLTNGCCWNHSASKPTTKSLPHRLGPLGYRVGLAGKVHVLPPYAFPFEKVSGFQSNCVAVTDDYDCQGIERFMTRKPDEPFCLVVALTSPHVPWTVGDPSRFDPATLRLPPHLADTPETRSDFAKYLAEIAHLDRQIGDILKTLETAGQADDTLVLFTSEQGAQFPGCKWTNWDLGLHTALVARWPGHVASGARTDAIVQYADVLPTLLDAAGAEKPQEVDGASFLPVLRGEKTTHRQYAYGIHNNIPEGPPYPIRTIRSADFRYIRNLSHEKMYIEKHMMGQAQWHDYWLSWVFHSWKDPRTYKLVERFQFRPAEQLYHTSTDPFEMANVAEDPDYADVKARLSGELDRFLETHGDTGTRLDTLEAWNASKRAAAQARPAGTASGN